MVHFGLSGGGGCGGRDVVAADDMSVDIPGVVLMAFSVVVGGMGQHVPEAKHGPSKNPQFGQVYLDSPDSRQLRH